MLEVFSLLGKAFLKVKCFGLFFPILSFCYYFGTSCLHYSLFAGEIGFMVLGLHNDVLKIPNSSLA